jgi:hypothetical protein
MSYLLIVFVVMVALSPLLSMLPSKRQRQLADLRQAAASAGLYVELLPTPVAADAPREVLYGCRRQRGDKPSSGRVRYQREEAQWRAIARTWPAERLELLPELPAGVSEIREDGTGISVIWDEQGAPEDVEMIARILRRMLGRHY